MYGFATGDFKIRDEMTGYYVEKTAQTPKERYIIDDLFQELLSRSVEIGSADHLWDIAGRVSTSALNWPLCRMAFVQFRSKEIVCGGDFPIRPAAEGR